MSPTELTKDCHITLQSDSPRSLHFLYIRVTCQIFGIFFILIILYYIRISTFEMMTNLFTLLSNFLFRINFAQYIEYNTQTVIGTLSKKWETSGWGFRSLADFIWKKSLSYVLAPVVTASSMVRILCLLWKWVKFFCQSFYRFEQFNFHLRNMIIS